MCRRLFLCIPFLLSVLCGCGVFQAKPEAEALVTRYFSAIKSGAYQDAVPLFSEEFYQETSKEELVKSLKKLPGKFGTLENYEQVSYSIEANPSRGGTIVTLVYQVKYSRYETKETFVVVKPRTGEPASIIGHTTKAEGLLMALLSSGSTV